MNKLDLAHVSSSLRKQWHHRVAMHPVSSVQEFRQNELEIRNQLQSLFFERMTAPTETRAKIDKEVNRLRHVLNLINKERNHGK